MNIIGLVCAASVFLATNAMAQTGGRATQKTIVRLGTATPGGGFPLYGNAFAEVMNAADPALSIEPRNTRNTKGSIENIPLLEGDNLHIALVPANPLMKHSWRSEGRARISNPDGDDDETGTVWAKRPPCKKLPQAGATAAANTVAAALDPDLLHPGVMRYLREIAAK